MLSAIPYELQALDQWVVAGPDKVPHDPRNLRKADVTDPSTWGSFAQALAAGWPHVGFVLSTSDPYCIIDLDDPRVTNKEPEPDPAVVERRVERHRKICSFFPTYIETSQSGTGLHIICRASVPRGVRRDNVEMYCSGRYMICTGLVYNAMPIADCQEIVNDLFQSMDTTPLAAELVQVDSVISDDALYQMASGAANAEKFNLLWSGDWSREYPSQSEADFALLSMLAYYTKDNAQVIRMFRWSQLGQRAKAHRDDYIIRMLGKMRAKEVPMVDLSYLLSKNENQLASRTLQQPGTEADEKLSAPCLLQPSSDPVATVEPQGAQVYSASSELPIPAAQASPVEFPVGFIGEAAEYFMSSSIRPVREIALATSIALLAGVVGRSYNISGSGLNQYIILLAKTGSGKEGAATGIDALITAVRPRIPMADDFVGPSAFASGQALVRVLDKQPCFVSVLGEFGLTLQSLNDLNASGSQVILKKVLLDVYAKSGYNKILRSSVYSDAEKNTKVVRAPNITILGESTPDIFYDGLDANSVAQGLIPRFSIFEYTGPRPDRNPNAFHLPPKELVEKFEMFVATALTAQQNQAHCPVMVNPDAQAMLDEFDAYATREINKTGGDVINQLWNRAHLKALKLAALVAVGCNVNAPVVDVAAASWACRCVERDIQTLLARFADGGVGYGDGRMESDMRRAIQDYATMPWPVRKAYEVPDSLLSAPVIPLCYLRRRLRTLASYRNDRRGTNAAIAATVKALMETNELAQVAPVQVKQSYGTNMPCYGIPTT